MTVCTYRRSATCYFPKLVVSFSYFELAFSKSWRYYQNSLQKMVQFVLKWRRLFASRDTDYNVQYCDVLRIKVFWNFFHRRVLLWLKWSLKLEFFNGSFCLWVFFSQLLFDFFSHISIFYTLLMLATSLWKKIVGKHSGENNVKVRLLPNYRSILSTEVLKIVGACILSKHLRSLQNLPRRSWVRRTSQQLRFTGLSPC